MAERRGQGIIIGKRTLANGKNRYTGYDEPLTFVPKGTVNRLPHRIRPAPEARIRPTQAHLRRGGGVPAPSFVEAFDAYAHAIACGAPFIVQADRFADLTAAHRARMNQLHEAEETVTRVWDRLLQCLDEPGITVAVENKSFEREVAL